MATPASAIDDKIATILIGVLPISIIFFCYAIGVYLLFHPPFPLQTASDIMRGETPSWGNRSPLPPDSEEREIEFWVPPEEPEFEEIELHAWSATQSSAGTVQIVQASRPSWSADTLADQFV